MPCPISVSSSSPRFFVFSICFTCCVPTDKLHEMSKRGASERVHTSLYVRVCFPCLCEKGEVYTSSSTVSSLIRWLRAAAARARAA